METVRQIIDGRLLSKVIALPQSMQNARLEITVKQVEEKVKPTLTMDELMAMLPGSRTEHLTGILKDAPEDLTIEKIREERLTEKYGRFD